MTALLQFRNLSLDYHTAEGWSRAVSDATLELRPGEVLGLVGESGSGKTTLGLAALGHLPENGRVAGGQALFEGHDMLALPYGALSRLRGARIGFVPQNPTTALNPGLRIGTQIAEGLRRHTDLSGEAIAKRCRTLLEDVGIRDVAGVLGRYPHQLSGGQQQRVAIAMAMSCHPPLIVLDEPTTGLDVTIQRQIVGLLKDLRRVHRIAMLYITHDLPLLSTIADRIAVMRRGQLVESGATKDVLFRPADDYTRELVAAVPDPDAASPIPLTGTAAPVLTADRLVIGYAQGGFPWRRTHAPVVQDVSLTLSPNETLALIGESGSGKSTTARSLCGLTPRLSGQVKLDGADLPSRLRERDATGLRDIQYVFQNPDASLNPRQSVAQILIRPLDVFFGVKGADALRRAREALGEVELGPAYLDRRPSELSGGQRQRVAIARALLANSRVLLCDEVLSALDVSVQARIIELLVRIRDERRIAMLFISHDLSVVKALAHRVAVMQAGRIVETGPTDAIFTRPEHPYTQSLLATVQRLTPTV